MSLLETNVVDVIDFLVFVAIDIVIVVVVVDVFVTMFVVVVYIVVAALFVNSDHIIFSFGH